MSELKLDAKRSIERPSETSKSETYLIEGMDCNSCATSLENHIRKLEHVRAVQVSFATGKMKVSHHTAGAEIVKEVERVGYKAFSVTGKNTKQPLHQQSITLVMVTGFLLALGYFGSYFAMPDLISTALYAVVLAITGYKPLKSAYYAIRSGSLDMNVLMSGAAIGAALIGEWLEGAMVLWLFALGMMLQTRSIERTRNSVRTLMDLTPPVAFVKSNDGLVKIPVEEVVIGDVIVIRPGEKVPLDGEVIQGNSTMNQAPITGESLPVDKITGDMVYAGSINESGSVEVRVTKLVEDTTIARIIHLIEEAQEKKAPTEAFVDRFAKIYTPIVFGMAAILIVIPPIIGFGSWSEWFYRGLALLVVACPCALVISTPVAIVSAIGNAAKNGILIKGGTFVELAGKINTFTFDKTGTLTEGKPKVTFVEPLNTTKEQLIAIARTIEEYSTHPIAKAVMDYSKDAKITSKEGSQYRAIPGKGAVAVIEGVEYFAGNAKLFEEFGFFQSEMIEKKQKLQQLGYTLIFLGTKEELLGIIGITDTIRTTSVSTITRLKKLGIKEIIMLTGDNEGTATKIAKEATVDRFFAELLPEDKAEAIRNVQSEGKMVAMVGDGINDAPALATANLGIAMGGAGTDTAMETADIVLMADNLEKLPHTVNLSRKAVRIIKQNIWFSIVIKVIALIFIFPGWLTLWLAILSDTGAALLVILNSMRLLKLKD